MTGLLRQLSKAPQAWATFSPEEFAEQRAGGSTRRVLEAIEQISSQLLGAATQRELFTRIAEVCAAALDYPYISFLLFDDDLQHLDVAGLSNPQINLLTLRRGPDVIYRSSFSTEELRELGWVMAVQEGKVYVTTSAHDLFKPFASSSRARTIVRKLGIAQGIIVPLVSRGKLLGAMKACSRNSEYAPGERSDLLTLARHIGLTAEMWRLYNRAETRSAVLKRLHSLSQTITGILDLDLLYKEIVKAAGRFAHIDFCSINLLSPDQKTYRNYAAWGEGTRAEVLQGRRTVDIFPAHLWERALEGEAILLPDLSLYPAVQERFKPRGAQSIAVFTFKWQGKVVGTLTVGRELPGRWEPDTVEVLQELTEYMTVAFTNARRFAEEQRQVDVQKALAASAHMIARAETRSVIDAIAKAGTDLFMSSRFAVLLPDDKGSLIGVASHGTQAEDALGFWVHKGQGLVGRVMETQMPLVTGDLHLERGVASRAFAELADYHSLMAVPMVGDTGALGVLVVAHTEVDLYGQSDVSLLCTLADHATIALQNEKHLGEARRTAAEQKALMESARLIARAETDSVLQTIVQAGSTLVMDSQFGVLLPDGDNLMCVAAYGPQTEKVLGSGVQIENSLVGKVYLTNQPILVADVQHTRGSLRPDIDVAADFHSWMAVPMMTERGCIGVLVASHTDWGIYTQSHLELLSTLADHASIALEKGKLLQEAKQKAAEQAALAESAHSIARLDVKAVLNTIVAQASKIVKQSRCSVFLYNSEANALLWAAGTESPIEVQTEVFSPNGGLMGHVFTTSEPLLVDNMMDDPRTVARHLGDVTGTKSFICVPLRWGSDTLGVIIATHREIGVFSRHDLELLSTFADHAAIALSNARLYDSLRLREEERAFLLHELMTGQEAERRRVAVDIHDGPLQSIGVNILAVDRVRKLLEMGRTSDATAELLEMRSGMSSVVQELRDVINALRPAVLENLGLLAAIASHLTHFREQTGVKAHLEDNLHGYRLPASHEVVFFRLLQEALTNVRKHAIADSVWVTLDRYDEMFEMSVTDNGIGFDPRATVSLLESGHIGLHSMQERIEAIGGSMEIDSTKGQGTRVTFRCPD